MPTATIITPTFSNGATLAYTIETVRRQTFTDYEHIIVGDGAVEAGREIARDYAESDPRVRFFDNPKGPNHGETYRDAAIRQSGGRIVCYVSDDDLWFDDHLETLAALLESADFAYTLTACPLANGDIDLIYGDMSNPVYRERMLAGRQNFIAPSAVAHTREAYNRLPHGWTTAKPGDFADLTCWRQFLEIPDLRFRFSGKVTALHPPAQDPHRAAGEQVRLDQLAAWSAVLSDESRAAQLRSELVDLLYRHACDRQANGWHHEQRADDGYWFAGEYKRHAEDLERRLAACQEELAARPAGLRDALRLRLRR
jgi:hypothetical protein